MEPVPLPLLEAGPGAGRERSPDAAAMAVPQTNHGSGAGGWTFHLTTERQGQGTGQWWEGWGRADRRAVEGTFRSPGAVGLHWADAVVTSRDSVPKGVIVTVSDSSAKQT